MKNINAYRYAVMVGNNWLATPFALNYGYDRNDHNIEEDYLDYDYNPKTDETQWYNNFGKSKREVQNEIIKYANPKTYESSIVFGCIKPNVRFNTKNYNHVHLMIKDGIIKIFCSWMHQSRNKFTPPHIDECDILYSGFIDDEYPNMFMTFDSMLFKYTSELYCDDMRLRLIGDNLTACKSIDNMNDYVGVVRFDEGAEFGSFERFSCIKTIYIDDTTKKRLIRIGDVLKYEFEEEAVEE